MSLIVTVAVACTVVILGCLAATILIALAFAVFLREHSDGLARLAAHERHHHETALAEFRGTLHCERKASRDELARIAAAHAETTREAILAMRACQEAADKLRYER